MSGNIPPYAQFGTNTVPPFQAAPIRVEDSAPDYMLEIRQQPQHARVALGKDKADRKPIDPPPILQLKVSHRKDPMQNFLQSPYFFMSCNLLKGDETPGREPQPSSLIGTVVSSLHRLKDTDNQDGGFFVFGDLSCKVEGRFRLLFSLYQMQKTDCYHITSIVSDVFQVYPTKSFPGLAESTFLTRSFSDQGVRLRLRKDSRSTSSRKRNATVAAFSRKGHGHSDTDNGSSRGLPSRSSTLDSGGLGYGSMGRGATAAESYDAQASAYAATHGYGATATDLTAYGAPRGYGAASMGMPVSTAAAYSMSPLATTSTATLAYGMATTAPTHSRHPLSRIETQLAAAAAAAQGGGAGFPSPASRQSPHAYGYTMQPSPSPGEYRGEYRTHASALYVGGLSAEASPRTHPTPNPHQAASSGAGTSPPEATTANYTAVGVGSMAPYSQGLSPYSYGLGEAQTLPPPSMGMRPHGPPTLDLQGGLGLELGYDVERQH